MWSLGKIEVFFGSGKWFNDVGPNEIFVERWCPGFIGTFDCS